MIGASRSRSLADGGRLRRIPPLSPRRRAARRLASGRTQGAAPPRPAAGPRKRTCRRARRAPLLRRRQRCSRRRSQRERTAATRRRSAAGSRFLINHDHKSPESEARGKARHAADTTTHGPDRLDRQRIGPRSARPATASPYKTRRRAPEVPEHDSQGRSSNLRAQGTRCPLKRMLRASAADRTTSMDPWRRPRAGPCSINAAAHLQDPADPWKAWRTQGGCVRNGAQFFLCNSFSAFDRRVMRSSTAPSRYPFKTPCGMRQFNLSSFERGTPRLTGQARRRRRRSEVDLGGATRSLPKIIGSSTS